MPEMAKRHKEKKKRKKPSGIELIRKKDDFGRHEVRIKGAINDRLGGPCRTLRSQKQEQGKRGKNFPSVIYTTGSHSRVAKFGHKPATIRDRTLARLGN